MSRRKTPRLYGIGCVFQFPGARILDGRRKPDRPRFVGLVRPCLTKKGYVLCPFVRRAFIFRTVIPEVFKSPERAWEWITHHATGWTYGEHQTIMTPLTDPILRNRKRWRMLKDFQFRRVFGQLVLAGICALWTSASPSITLLVKIGGIGLLISAVIDILEIWKRYF